jgi:hypothetical protein
MGRRPSPKRKRLKNTKENSSLLRRTISPMIALSSWFSCFNRCTSVLEVCPFLVCFRIHLRIVSSVIKNVFGASGIDIPSSLTANNIFARCSGLMRVAICGTQWCPSKGADLCTVYRGHASARGVGCGIPPARFVFRTINEGESVGSANIRDASAVRIHRSPISPDQSTGTLDACCTGSVAPEVYFENTAVSSFLIRRACSSSCV